MLTAMRLPPIDPQERRFLKQFLGERPRRLRARIEYPLMLAATGVARFRPSQVTESNCTAHTAEEWGQYRRAWLDQHWGGETLELLQRAYRWSDQVAGHLAQHYRSGRVVNFVLGV